MRIRTLGFVVFIGFANFCTAQNDTSGFLFSNPFEALESNKGVLVTTSASASSNAFNTGMYSDYIFSNKFRNKSLNSFANQSSIRNNSDFQFRSTITIKGIRSISLDYDRRTLLKTGKDLSSLVLFGNKTFAGKLISSDDNSLLNYKRINLTVGKMSAKTTLELVGPTLQGESRLVKKWTMNYSLGISLLLQHSLFKSDFSSVFTEEEGEYIDLVVHDGLMTRNVKNPGGIGLIGNYQFYYQPNSKSIFSFGLQDLSIYYGKRNERLKVDTSLRYDGFAVKVEDFFSGNIRNYTDSALNAISHRDTTSSIVILPSQINASYARMFTEAHGLEIKLLANQWFFYGYAVSVSHLWKPQNSMYLKSTISYGNFSSLVISADLDVKLSGDWTIHTKLYGVNALMAEQKSSSYGMLLGLFRAL